MFTSIENFAKFLKSKGYTNFSTLDCTKGLFFDADSQKDFIVLKDKSIVKA